MQMLQCDVFRVLHYLAHGSSKDQVEVKVEDDDIPIKDQIPRTPPTRLCW